jgi:hypothetical protein
MLESTPMLSRQDSAHPRACQRDDPARVWTGAGTVNTPSLIAAVARAYTDVYDPEPAVTTAAILGPSRATHVAHARHLCAYLLAEDYHLTNRAVAQALGRADHTTTLNSRARVVAALDHDDALQRAITGARDILNGRSQRASRRPDHAHREAFATATPRELAKYRYWRAQFLRFGARGGAR